MQTLASDPVKAVVRRELDLPLAAEDPRARSSISRGLLLSSWRSRRPRTASPAHRCSSHAGVSESGADSLVLGWPAEARVHVRIARVAKESNEPSRTRLDSGWRELQEGRWAEARARFEQAAGAEETPEAFEGLSWAAWWLDDAEAVFAARERAYHLYKEAGTCAGAARMATWWPSINSTSTERSRSRAAGSVEPALARPARAWARARLACLPRGVHGARWWRDREGCGSWRRSAEFGRRF